MDLLSLITACAVSAHPGIITTLYQIGQIHDGDPLAIEVVEQGHVYTPPTHDQAIGITTALVEAGFQVRVGLAQVDAQTAMNDYGVAIPQLFDGCTNIAIGADQLTLTISELGGLERSLAAYFDREPSSEVGKAWAREVMQKPGPAPLGEEQTFTGRRYSIRNHRIFAGAPLDTDHRAPRPDETRQLMTEPEQLDALSSGSEESEESDEESEEREQPQKWPRPSEIQRNPPLTPQAPVTDERLPTSSAPSGGQ